MSDLKAIVNGLVYTGDAVIPDKAILIAGDTIKALVPRSEVPADAQLIEADNHIVAPGLIDLQIYGAGGRLFAADPTPETLHHIGETILASGTTGFMLTLATNPMEVYPRALDAVKADAHPALLGLHFEGPYLNPEKRGAHPTDYIRRPDTAEIEQMLQYAEGWLKMMTIAPELFDEETIRLLLRHGVLVSAGHSNATIEEAERGFGYGIQTVTHLFNGMSGFHHRQPGLPGAAFLSPKACASIIADGIHVDYQVLAVAKRLMGERLFLITDAIAESSGGVYDYVFTGDRFTLADGTLSGTSLCQLDAVANCVKNAGIPLDEALRMASLYPARLANADTVGRVAPGMRADLILFDRDFILKKVIFRGKEQM